MNRKKGILTGILCIALLLTAGTTWANHGQGAVSENNGQTDIMAGIVVHFMGKLRFEVYQLGTKTPIEGVSVELYITSLDRYVLLGLTNVDGVYELDIAYNTDTSSNLGNRFQTLDGSSAMQETLLYFNSNEIRYQIYKSGWRPYPYHGSEKLEENKVLRVVIVYLYRSGTSSGGSGTGSSGSKSSYDLNIPAVEPFPPDPLYEGEKTGGIPKTGVGEATPCWFAGAVFFLLAGGVFIFHYQSTGRQRHNGEV